MALKSTVFKAELQVNDLDSTHAMSPYLHEHAELMRALAALPALALVGQSLQSVRGRRAADPARRLRERLAALPAEPSARLAALEDLTREAAALRLGRPAPGLDAEAIAPLGEAAARLYTDLLAARYGGGQIDDLERRVRAFVEETR
jgi:hypothetical protein